MIDIDNLNTVQPTFVHEPSAISSEMPYFRIKPVILLVKVLIRVKDALSDNRSTYDTYQMI